MRHALQIHGLSFFKWLHKKKFISENTERLLILASETEFVGRDMQEEKLSFGLRVRFEVLDVHWCAYF
jgi:hypothetical protein